MCQQFNQSRDERSNRVRSYLTSDSFQPAQANPIRRNSGRTKHSSSIPLASKSSVTGYACQTLSRSSLGLRFIICITSAASSLLPSFYLYRETSRLTGIYVVDKQVGRVSLAPSPWEQATTKKAHMAFSTNFICAIYAKRLAGARMLRHGVSG